MPRHGAKFAIDELALSPFCKIMLLAISGALALIAAFVDGGVVAIIMLFLSQAVLLLRCLREKTASSIGAFVFMSFVFFGLRPLYMTIEKDFALLTDLFFVAPTDEMVSSAMWWATAGLWLFAVFGINARRITRRKLAWRPVSSTKPAPLLPTGVCSSLIVYQFIAAIYIAVYGGVLQYGTEYGAYLYDFPVLLQGGQLFAVLANCERYMRSKGRGHAGSAILSVSLFIVFAVLMRSTTLFRGQWITGLMIMGLALGMRWRRRFPLWIIAASVLFMLPLFRLLGENRHTATTELIGNVREDSSLLLTFSGYWNFLDAKGDMNIFDTFVAAKQSQPAFYPYINSWLYVPFHLIPRRLWPSKPESGALQTLVLQTAPLTARESPVSLSWTVDCGGCWERWAPWEWC
jgi:hypothetical protein